MPGPRVRRGERVGVDKAGRLREVQISLQLAYIDLDQHVRRIFMREKGKTSALIARFSATRGALTLALPRPVRSTTLATAWSNVTSV